MEGKYGFMADFSNLRFGLLELALSPAHNKHIIGNRGEPDPNRCLKKAVQGTASLPFWFLHYNWMLYTNIPS